MRKALLAITFTALLHAGEFHTGQAARAVIGQTSFSAKDTGVNAHALSLFRGRLYAAENNRLLAFDPAKQCVLCGFEPVSILNQAVARGVAAMASLGRTFVAADEGNHRVLIWRSTAPTLGVIGAKDPDVVLKFADPVSVAYDGRHLFVGDGAAHRVFVWNGLPASADQPADATLGKADSAELGADSISMPTALVSDGTNLFVADADYHRILIFSAGDVNLEASSILNSATLYPTPLAPGALTTIRAAGLAETSESADASSTEPLPTRLANVEVYLNGAALPLLSVSSSEIQTLMPYDLGESTSGSLFVRSIREDGSTIVSNAAPVRFAPVSPGIFAVGKREPRTALILHASGEQDPGGGPVKGAPITDENPAKPGETITVWASGLGLVRHGDLQSPDGRTIYPVYAIVNGEPMEVLSARLPKGVVGVYEVVVALPPKFPPGQEMRLQLSQNAVSSNTVIFPVAAN